MLVGQAYECDCGASACLNLAHVKRFSSNQDVRVQQKTQSLSSLLSRGQILTDAAVGCHPFCLRGCLSCLGERVTYVRPRPRPRPPLRHRPIVQTPSASLPWFHDHQAAPGSDAMQRIATECTPLAPPKFAVIGTLASLVAGSRPRPCKHPKPRMPRVPDGMSRLLLDDRPRVPDSAAVGTLGRSEHPGATIPPSGLSLWEGVRACPAVDAGLRVEEEDASC